MIKMLFVRVKSNLQNKYCEMVKIITVSLKPFHFHNETNEPETLSFYGFQCKFIELLG